MRARRIPTTKNTKTMNHKDTKAQRRRTIASRRAHRGHRERQDARGISRGGNPPTGSSVRFRLSPRSARKAARRGLCALRGGRPWRFRRFVPWCLGGWAFLGADSGCAGRGGQREVCFTEQSQMGTAPLAEDAENTENGRRVTTKAGRHKEAGYRRKQRFRRFVPRRVPSLSRGCLGGWICAVHRLGSAISASPARDTFSSSCPARGLSVAREGRHSYNSGPLDGSGLMRGQAR